MEYLITLILGATVVTPLDDRMIEYYEGDFYISGDRGGECVMYSTRAEDNCEIHDYQLPADCRGISTVRGFDEGGYVGLYSVGDGSEECAIVWDLDDMSVAYKGTQRHVHDIFTDSNGTIWATVGDDYAEFRGNAMLLKDWKPYKIGQQYQYTKLIEYNGRVRGGSDNPTKGSYIEDIYNGERITLGPKRTDVWDMEIRDGSLYIATVAERAGIETNVFKYDGESVEVAARYITSEPWEGFWGLWQAPNMNKEALLPFITVLKKR